MSIDSDRTRLTAQIGSNVTNTPIERAKARLTVVERAHDADDMAELLAMLGLDDERPRDAV
ncbi:hypothetical protein BJF85_16695 [Saccharomonospora sp. CUA-673]|uniref:hypothetical protein n=1 Tax=Saccharomonospora sp. CUA-673 TaxID=1904969 RepID=UPI000968A791|nr:hypothetical protein [Saccharomonospora sp. CUA-673]OLT46482.1 hypothetical protein BJF85_16695 [Saccharomonospora sp. CUA-673]